MKKSKGKKKKLKSSKEEMDVEKPSEEPQNLPEEEVPLVSEVRLFFCFDKCMAS